MSAQLILIPTPLIDNLPIEPIAQKLLLDTCLNPDVVIVVEELRPTRRRWTSWGLPREAIEKFKTLNEHSTPIEVQSFYSELKMNKTILLLSDCGLPACHDPGKELVNFCHENSISISSTPFSNSIMLALALSGLETDQFVCMGFIPKDESTKKSYYKKMFLSDIVTVFLERPYSLKNVLGDLFSQFKGSGRKILIAQNLNCPDEIVKRDIIENLLKFNFIKKAPFIVVVDKNNNRL